MPHTKNFPVTLVNGGQVLVEMEPATSDIFISLNARLIVGIRQHSDKPGLGIWMRPKNAVVYQYLGTIKLEESPGNVIAWEIVVSTGLDRRLESIAAECLAEQAKELWLNGTPNAVRLLSKPVPR